MENREWLEALSKRLAAWGYRAALAGEAEAGLELALARGMAYLRQFCGLTEQESLAAGLDKELGEVWLDLAGAYYLQAKLVFGGAGDNGDGSDNCGIGVAGAISSVKLGDAAVSFVSGDSGVSGFIDEVMRECRQRLAVYRRLRF